MENDLKKAVLTNRIIMPKNELNISNLANNLSYTFVVNTLTGATENYLDIRYLPRDLLSIPISRTDLIPKDFKIVDKRINEEVYFPEFRATLRESQQKIYDAVNDSCVINAKPGYGKTFTALAIAAKLKRKTLIVVHTLKIKSYWMEEIEKVFGIKAGEIGAKNIDTKPVIVVSNTQTLIKHINSVRKDYGLVIVDEVHHLPAKTFKEIIDRLHARYKIGLSATISRRDGKQLLIWDYISKNIYNPPQENVMEPHIIVVETEVRLPGTAFDSYASRVNRLYQDNNYIRLVCGLAAIQADKGHKVLVVSDRVDFLHYCSSLMENSVCVTSSVDNQEELEQQIKTGEKQILFGSIKIYSEGVSFNWLSSLILGCPIKTDALLEQAIGRIQRKYENKKQPEVIDIKLSGVTGKNQFRSRLAKYMAEGWKVSYIKNVQI